LKRVFAFGLLAMAPLTLAKQYFLEKRQANPPTANGGAAVRKVSLTHAAIAGAGVGFFSGLSGFGAGLLMSSFLTLTTDLQQQQIVGTALLALTLPNLAQVAMHLRVGSIVKPVAAAVALGAVIGAPVGSAVALHLDDRQLRYVFAAFMTIQGTRALVSLRRVKV
jgi:uncharacterized membrane protein YfcA